MSDGASRVQATRERELNRKAIPALARKFDIDVVGVSFQPGYPGNLYELERIQFMAEDAGEPIVVVLVREPDNEYDANAIGVHVPALGEIGKIGMITRPVAARLAPHLDAGETWAGYVSQLKLHPDHPDRPGLRVILRKVEPDA